MSISATTTNTQNHHFFQIGLFATVLFGLLIILSLSNDAPNNLRLNHPEPSRTRERHRNDAMPKLLRQILVFGLLTLDIALLRGDIELIHVRRDIRRLLIRRPPGHIRHHGIIGSARERRVRAIGGR